MQAILYSCERHLEATDFERLVGEMLAHLRLEHPKAGLGESQV